ARGRRAGQDCGDAGVLPLMTRRFFGTDGVRGPYGGPVINESFAARLGVAVATWRAGRGRVVVGRDTRFSGESLERAVRRGLHAAGAEPISLGVLPTPAVARAVGAEDATLGVMITASHNPAADNGFKIFARDGLKLTDDEELRIEQLLPERLADGGAGGTAPGAGPAIVRATI